MKVKSLNGARLRVLGSCFSLHLPTKFDVQRQLMRPNPVHPCPHTPCQLKLVKATFWIFNVSPSQAPHPWLPVAAKCVQFSSGSDLVYATLVPPRFAARVWSSSDKMRYGVGGYGEMGIKLIKRLGQLRSGQVNGRRRRLRWVCQI